jgi:hypothetical protein
MKKYCPSGNLTDAFNVYGYTVAQGLVQVLKKAGDNLTRENVMKQAASLDFTLPMLLPGVNVKTGPTTSTRSSASSWRASTARPGCCSAPARARFCLSKPSVLRNDIPHNESKRGKRRFIQGRQH